MKLAKLCILAAAAALIGISANVHAQGGIELGVITCSVIPGSRVNLLIRSTADVECVFNNQGTEEHYVGETGIALGLDLSFKGDEKIAFTVIAVAEDARPGAHALAGKYVGAEISATVGIGLGLKALVGGGDNNISLQPLALETSTGLGASGGLGFLYLEAKE